VVDCQNILGKELFKKTYLKNDNCNFLRELVCIYMYVCLVLLGRERERKNDGCKSLMISISVHEQLH